MAFTCSNVLKALKLVEDWLGEDGLGVYLYIPDEKREEIQQQYDDPDEQKKQLILYWMATDPLASWRRLIRELDDMCLCPVADAIRDFAEPDLPGIHTHSLKPAWAQKKEQYSFYGSSSLRQYHSVGRHYRHASRNTFSKPPNSQTKAFYVASYTPGPLL